MNGINAIEQMSMAGLMTTAKLLWSERESKGYIADFQAAYPLVKARLAAMGIIVIEALNTLNFESTRNE